MDRNQTIFLGFIGPAIEQEEKVFEIGDGYECWNIKKFTYDEFIEDVKAKIPPINDNVLRNYAVEEQRDIYGLSKKQFGECSWGLFIPERMENICVDAYSETLFLLNLYSPDFLYPLFYVGDTGITRHKYPHKYDWAYLAYAHTQNQAHLFKKEEFVTFFKLLMEQGGYGTWYLDRIQNWEKEDWRLYVASRLFLGLRDYDMGKDPFEWQRETAEMGTALESLFTAGDGQTQEVIYRLTKRVAVMLSSKFPDVEKDIKKLYKLRSLFVHGEFFNSIAKESRRGLTDTPSPDFELLYKQREYVRWALATYLYLAKQVKSNEEDYGSIDCVATLLERSIIDTQLRDKVLKDAKVVMDLLPQRNG